MPKPTSVPTWATNVNYPASSQPWASTATKVQPPSSVQMIGHEPENPVVAQYENWILNLWGQWASFVDSLFDASTNLTLPVNSSVTVSGTGEFKHGTRTLTIPASAFSADVASTYNLAGYRTLSGFGRALAYIPLPAGKRILSCTVWYDPQASGGVIPRLMRQTISSGTQNYIWQGVSDATGSAIESQTGSALNYTMLSTEFYAFEIAIAGASNRIWGATIDYDAP